MKKKITGVQGVPEWMPNIRSMELDWIKIISMVYESFGYGPIETCAFEPLEVLEGKGEINKEIYYVSKNHNIGNEKYGMHYDLTIPFARYVAQNFGKLTFPFKRYQLQKVWRGERPQRGRYREFYQCDIDVIANESLSPYYDVEVLYAGEKAMQKLNIPPYVVGISNRKIYEGYLTEIGIKDCVSVLRIIDKIDKLGIDGVAKILRDDFLFSNDLIDKALILTSVKSYDLSFVDQFNALDIHSEVAKEGIFELEKTFSTLLQMGCKNFMVDLSFVRGFDYYTGVIFEGKFIDDPHYGSICSGGRYENLTSSFIDRQLPGVGFSIGLTRIFAKMVLEDIIHVKEKNLVDMLILRTRENDIVEVLKLGDTLRDRGHKVDIYPDATKIIKQLQYASKCKYTWVWIESLSEPGVFEVKNMETGVQAKVSDPSLWPGV